MKWSWSKQGTNPTPFWRDRGRPKKLSIIVVPNEFELSTFRIRILVVTAVLIRSVTQYSNYCNFIPSLRPPLWSSGQSSWLLIQRCGFDSRRYQIFREVVGLERGVLSLVSTIEELLERKSSGCGLKNREYGRRDPSRWPRGTFYPQKVGTNVADKQWSLGIVRSRT
jgi:hypothetical protein